MLETDSTAIASRFGWECRWFQDRLLNAFEMCGVLLGALNFGLSLQDWSKGDRSPCFLKHGSGS